MRIRLFVAIFFALGVATVLGSSSEFGDIAANQLTLKLTPVEPEIAERAGWTGGVQYLVLHDGVVQLCDSLEPAQSKNSRSGHLEIINLDANVTAAPATQPASPTRMLRFSSVQGGWARDSYDLVLTLPYTIDPRDPRNMIHVCDHGTIETRWRDPQNANVDVIGYWSGIGGIADLKVDVIRCTLGFNNKLSK